MDPEKNSLNFIFPTKYVIPKSLKFSHWPSKLFIGFSSWWLNQPLWKICSSNWESSPNRGEKKKYSKPPPSFPLFSPSILGVKKLPLFLVQHPCALKSLQITPYDEGTLDTWMSRVPEVNGSMVIGSMGYFTDPYKWGIPWGEKNHLHTIDPNFLGHPSTPFQTRTS